jgi:hypothetical protein
MQVVGSCYEVGVWMTSALSRSFSMASETAAATLPPMRVTCGERVTRVTDRHHDVYYRIMSEQPQNRQQLTLII